MILSITLFSLLLVKYLLLSSSEDLFIGTASGLISDVIADVFVA